MSKALRIFANTTPPISWLLALVRAVRGLVRRLSTRARLWRLLGTRRDICLELGAGNKRGGGDWLTIDLTSKCDLYWDLNRGIPFPDGSVKKIYSSHLLEHLTFKEGQRLLAECRRVLAPGGTISVCVPNARLYIEAYLSNRLLDTTRFLGYLPAFNKTTAIDYVNYTAYLDGHHKYMFDLDNLVHVLSTSGFRKARPRAFDPGLDSQERDFESIYAEAEK